MLCNGDAAFYTTPASQMSQRMPFLHCPKDVYWAEILKFYQFHQPKPFSCPTWLKHRSGRCRSLGAGHIGLAHLRTPLVDWHSNGQPPFLMGDTSSNGGFPIAMLVYRSVSRLFGLKKWVFHPKNIAIQNLFRAHELVQFPFRRFTPSTVHQMFVDILNVALLPVRDINSRDPPPIGPSPDRIEYRIPDLVAKTALWRWNNSRCRSGTWQQNPPIFLHFNTGRFTWNLQITHLERKMIFQTSMSMFHVNLQGCNKKGMEDGTSFWMKFLPFLNHSCIILSILWLKHLYQKNAFQVSTWISIIPCYHPTAIPLKCTQPMALPRVHKCL